LREKEEQWTILNVVLVVILTFTTMLDKETNGKWIKQEHV